MKQSPAYLWVGRYDREDRAQEAAKKIEDLGLPVEVIPRYNNAGEEFYWSFRAPSAQRDYRASRTACNARLPRRSSHSQSPGKSKVQPMIKFGARTDTGRVRENNEDCYGFAPEIGLFVLSDGMGGMASGEVASRLAVETVLAHCREAQADPSLPFVGGRIEGTSDASNRLASAIRLANQVIFRAAQQNPAQQGMGATVVAVRFANGRMSLAHAGDSRAYRLRAGALEQLTQDHSFVAESVRRGFMNEQEAGASKLQNVLIRALGVEPELEVDVAEDVVIEGDTILLCSDGLTRELSDSQIAAVLGDTRDPRKAAAVGGPGEPRGRRGQDHGRVLRDAGASPPGRSRGAGGLDGAVRKLCRARRRGGRAATFES